MFFYVFGKKIFATYFIPVSIMVDSLIWKYSNFVKCFGDKLFLTPINIPIILLCLFKISFTQSCGNTICEISFKFNIRTTLIKRLTQELENNLFLYIFESTPTFQFYIITHMTMKNNSYNVLLYFLLYIKNTNIHKFSTK